MAEWQATHTHTTAHPPPEWAEGNGHRSSHGVLCLCCGSHHQPTPPTTTHCSTSASPPPPPPHQECPYPWSKDPPWWYVVMACRQDTWCGAGRRFVSAPTTTSRPHPVECSQSSNTQMVIWYLLPHMICSHEKKWGGVLLLSNIERYS